MWPADDLDRYMTSAEELAQRAAETGRSVDEMLDTMRSLREELMVALRVIDGLRPPF